MNYIIEEIDLTNLSKNELLVKCQKLGLTKCKSKNKGELIDLINNALTQKKQNKLIIEEDANNLEEVIDENISASTTPPASRRLTTSLQ